MIPGRSRARGRLRVLGAVGALAMVAGVAAACDPPPPDPPSPPPPPPSSVYEAACAGTLVASTPGSVAWAEVDELSGIAASRRNSGVWWVHNDSGNAAKVFAIGDDGRNFAQLTLDGAANVDWEDVAVGPGPVASTHYLYVGDIGDWSLAELKSTRASIAVYRVPEPEVDTGALNVSGTLPGAAKLDLTYPGGAKYDAEALLVDPATGELYIVTKDWVGSTARVFRAPANLADGSSTVLVEVATIPLGFVTAADVTAAGDFVAVRTYSAVRVYPRPAGGSLVDAFAQSPCNGATRSEAQGEAIGFTADGRGYVTASEGASPPLHRFVAP